MVVIFPLSDYPDFRSSFALPIFFRAFFLLHWHDDFLLTYFTDCYCSKLEYKRLSKQYETSLENLLYLRMREGFICIVFLYSFVDKFIILIRIYRKASWYPGANGWHRENWTSSNNTMETRNLYRIHYLCSMGECETNVRIVILQVS